jgi:hypothetical protein
MPDLNNETNRVAALDHARLAGNNWRSGRDNARKLGRFLCVAAVVDGFAFEPLVAEAKTAMQYNKLDKTDKGGVRVFFTACRTIVGAWGALPQASKDAFIAGNLIYSTLAADIVKAEKAAEKAGEEEAETARLAELGISAEEEKANKEAETEAFLNVAAIERAIAMFTPTVPANRSEGETAAMIRMIDTIIAYQAAMLAESEGEVANG